MSLRVLLADESASIRKVFQMGLQDFGAEVKSVHNGLDVVEVAQSYEPDIIFADILLQKKNGYEVCTEVKDSSSLSSIPVVLMWSSFMELDQSKYKSSGANAELEKPFDVEKMRTLIKDLVENTRSQQLSGFLQFPDSITQEFVEEEKERAENPQGPNDQGHEAQNSPEPDPPRTHSMPQQTVATEPPPAPSMANAPATESPRTSSTPPPIPNDEPLSFSIDEDENPLADLSLEDDAEPPAPEWEATSEFNLKADDDDDSDNEDEIVEFSMYEVPPAQKPAAKEPAMETPTEDQWQARPLNDNRNDEKTKTQTDTDLDQFQSMDLGGEKKMNLDDFLYKPPTTPPAEKPRRQTSEFSINSEIHNVQIPNYENTVASSGSSMRPEEMESIVRAELQIMLNRVIKEQLPSILEKVVREELEKVLQQELALKNNDPSSR